MVIAGGDGAVDLEVAKRALNAVALLIKRLAMLSNAIGRIVDLYPPQKCANYFANAGYDAD